MRRGVLPIVVRDRLLTTGEAARALSIDRSTLARWQREHVVEPVFVTLGGHARWDLDDLKRQIRARPPAE